MSDELKKKGFRKLTFSFSKLKCSIFIFQNENKKQKTCICARVKIQLITHHSSPIKFLNNVNLATDNTVGGQLHFFFKLFHVFKVGFQVHTPL